MFIRFKKSYWANRLAREKLQIINKTTLLYVRSGSGGPPLVGAEKLLISNSLDRQLGLEDQQRRDQPYKNPSGRLEFLTIFFVIRIQHSWPMAIGANRLLQGIRNGKGPFVLLCSALHFRWPFPEFTAKNSLWFIRRVISLVNNYKM